MWPDKGVRLLKKTPPALAIDPIEIAALTQESGGSGGLTPQQQAEIAEAEGIEYTESGIDALVYAADGDMRKAINALQAASATGDVVDEEAVYAITSTARPEEIREMVTLALDGEFTAARAKLDELLVDSGIAGDDIIEGGSGDNVIDGGDGFDQIAVEVGAHSVDGGADFDSVQFAMEFIDMALDVSLTGDTLNDAATGSSIAFTNIENLTIAADTSGEYDDLIDLSSLTISATVRSEAGDDVITTGAGNDVIFGGSGDNVIDGGAGVDEIDVGVGNHIVDGGADFDELEFDLENTALALDLTVSGAMLTDAGSGSSIAFSNIEFLIVEADEIALDDQIDLTGLTIDSIVRAEAGDDIVTTGSANDEVFAGGGNDTILTGDGNDTVLGGTGDDTITTGSGDDYVVSDGDFQDISQTSGGTGDDVIDTGDGNDAVFAGGVESMSNIEYYTTAMRGGRSTW